ncbi:MAG: DUF6508 domain-containing protein [bacterium]
MKTCSLNESHVIEPPQLAALLAFVPVFEAASFCPDQVIPMDEDGFPDEEFKGVVSGFMDACYKNGFVVKFNWEDWGPEAERYKADPDLLKNADLATLRRLITWHIRQNRFSRDHLATQIAQGHILAILRRLSAT